MKRHEETHDVDAQIAEERREDEQLCTCGHKRGEHQDRVAGCALSHPAIGNCGCYSFRLAVQP